MAKRPACGVVDRSDGAPVMPRVLVALRQKWVTRRPGTVEAVIATLFEVDPKGITGQRSSKTKAKAGDSTE